MRAKIIIAAGVIMALSSAAHALLGWPAMRTSLEEAAAPENLVGALAVGWYFGSVAMLAFGIITVTGGLRLDRGDRSGVAAIAVIAGAYVLFGTGAIVVRHFNSHFLLFICTGLLAGGPLIETRRR